MEKKPHVFGGLIAIFSMAILIVAVVLTDSPFPDLAGIDLIIWLSIIGIIITTASMARTQ